MTFTKRLSFLCLGLLLPAPTLLAQGDPAKEIKEIAESVAEQLQEIDRLLLESGKKNQDRQKPKDLLEQARERSATVEDGIEKLIEKLTEMKNQGSSSSSSSGSESGEQQQDGQQSGEQRPGQGQGREQRRENQTPDFVQQPQPGAGQEQTKEQQSGQEDQPQAGGKPEGGEQTETPGQNQPGSPQQDATAPGQPGTGSGSWGELQPYLNFLRNRGASPKVPDKYRKYYEAYLKNKQKGDK